MNEDFIIKKLNSLIKKAEEHGEIPVAAVIVYNNKIIASSYNKTESKNNILSHAEINVILKASKKLNNWRLNGCKLYVKLEPCSMCQEIIKKSRINEVIFYIKQNSNVTEKNPKYSYIKNNEFSNKLKNHFKIIRNKK